MSQQHTFRVSHYNCIQCADTQMALKRNCIWCQEHAIHKRLRSEMPPVPIPRTQWLCAECNVHLCEPASGGNDCFKQFHKPLTAALDKDSALPVIYRTT